jgi:hypothetical protein
VRGRTADESSDVDNTQRKDAWKSLDQFHICDSGSVAIATSQTEFSAERLCRSIASAEARQSACTMLVKLPGEALLFRAVLLCATSGCGRFLVFERRKKIFLRGGFFSLRMASEGLGQTDSARKRRVGRNRRRELKDRPCAGSWVASAAVPFPPTRAIPQRSCRSVSDGVCTGRFTNAGHSKHTELAARERVEGVPGVVAAAVQGWLRAVCGEVSAAKTRATAFPLAQIIRNNCHIRGGQWK